MATSSSSSGPGGPYHHHRSRFGDTTLTKVFVGGLAWETPSEGLRHHFEAYGDILEAVVITDRETGRSKGYGFVSRPLTCSPSAPLAFAPADRPRAALYIRSMLSSSRYVLLYVSVGDFPGPRCGGAGGAEPEPGDRRPSRQLQHCGVRPAADRAAER
jgi:hypothetical protein